MEGKVLCRACILYMATLDPDRSTSVAADIHYLEAGPYLRHGSEGGLVTSPTVRDSWSARPAGQRKVVCMKCTKCMKRHFPRAVSRCHACPCLFLPVAQSCLPLYDASEGLHQQGCSLCCPCDATSFAIIALSPPEMLSLFLQAPFTSMTRTVVKVQIRTVVKVQIRTVVKVSPKNPTASNARNSRAVPTSIVVHSNHTSTRKPVFTFSSSFSFSFSSSLLPCSFSPLPGTSLAETHYLT